MDSNKLNMVQAKGQYDIYRDLLVWKQEFKIFSLKSILVGMPSIVWTKMVVEYNQTKWERIFIV